MKLYNIVKVYTSTVGTGTVTLGSAVPSFITFATAGVVNGSTVSYAIEDGNNREVGTGTYTSGAETLTRSVATSTNSNNLITLSGNAVVFITGLAADLSSDTANVASTLVQRDASGNFAAGAATLSSAVVPLISGGTTASSTLTLQSTSGAGTSDAIIFRTASQLERMRVSTAGDVNIGSANNAGNTLRYFDVYNTNTGASAGAITRLITSDVAGTGVAVGQMLKYKNGTMLFQNSETDSAASMQFYVGASERVRISSGGLVGIGLTPTTSLLEVNGEMAAINAFASLRLMQTVTGTGYRWALNNDGTLRLQYTTNAFSTASIPILIDSAGNVGIGMSSPGEKLVVVGNIVAGNTGTTADGYIDIDGGATGKVRISRTGTGATASGMVFYTQFSTLQERMRILSTGEVGIGTSSPKVALDINGRSRVLSANTSSPSAGKGIEFIFYSPTDTGYILCFDRDGAVHKPLDYAASVHTFGISGSEKMRLDSSGNLLVGTTTSSARLTVSSGSGPAALITSSLTGTTVRSNSVFRIQSEATGRDVYMQFSDNVTNATEIGMISGNTYFCTGAAERMRIDSSGNVGIGTGSTIRSILNTNVGTITGPAVTAGLTLTAFYSGVTAVNSIDWNYSGQSAFPVRLGATFNSDGNGMEMVFYTSTAFNATGSERMRINKDGNVGIGTSSPATSAKLEIAGTTGALLVPRLTTTERNALTAVNGMIIYNTTDNQMQGRINGAWVAM